jgi:hypothetical protein
MANARVRLTNGYNDARRAYDNEMHCAAKQHAERCRAGGVNKYDQKTELYAEYEVAMRAAAHTCGKAYDSAYGLAIANQPDSVVARLMNVIRP